MSTTPALDAQGGADLTDGSFARIELTPEQKAEQALDMFREILRLMGIPLPECTASIEDSQVVLSLGELDASLQPSPECRTLESVQFVLNKAINRYAGDHLRLTLDAEGFRKRRADGLEYIAAHLAERAAQLDKTLAIAPLTAEDVRALNLAVSRTRGVSAKTEGEGPAQRFLILPEGAEAEGGSRRRRRRRRRRGGGAGGDDAQGFDGPNASDDAGDDSGDEGDDGPIADEAEA